MKHRLYGHIVLLTAITVLHIHHSNAASKQQIAQQSLSKKLHQAIEGNNIDLIKELLSRGVDVNNKEHTTGKTPLHMAAKKGNLAIAHILLEAGANHDLRDNANESALHKAVNGGHFDIVGLLIHHKAKFNALSLHGKTPVMYAKQKLKACVAQESYLAQLPRTSYATPSMNSLKIHKTQASQRGGKR